MSAAAEDVEPMIARLDNEPMARHTSWRVGGPADAFYRPASLAELRALLAGLAAGTPVTWVGLGSNLLVRDAGIRGAVVSTANLPAVIERVDARRVRATAGTSCARLARQCTRWRLGPAVFFAGIPGTVGGALAMNAGAFGGETWARVVAVETIDRKGRLRERARDEFEIAYRRVSGPAGEWFVSGTWALDADETVDMAAIRETLAKRAATQPTGQASCGSVFRNPPGGYAGELIERAGLKGARAGGAFVSDKHANFIVNDGTATAADIEALIGRVRDAVERTAGVRLDLEVRIVGEPAGGGTDAD